jgi:hypothetical protein
VSAGVRHTPEQDLLLRAALLGGDAARAAWEEWRTRVPLDDADFPSQGVFPLVYRNLSRLGVDDPDLGRLKGHLRRTLYLNHMLFAAAGSALEALHEGGIETLILKGAPLAILRYGSPGLRPMSDVDILVPTDRALAAIRLLRELGWDSIDYPDPERMIELRHAEGFRRRSDGALIDLHWNALMQPFRDDDLWSAAIDIEIGGVPTRAPCATDQLLLVIVHSLLHDEFPGSLLWITDSAALLGAAGEDIDWDRLVDAARRRELTAPLAAGLDYLRELLGIVPEAVISELAGSPTRRLERAAFHAVANGAGRRKQLTLIADRHARLRRLDTPFPRPDLLIYLARSLGYPTRRQLLAVGVGTLARHASGRLRHPVSRTVAPPD